MPMQVHGKGFVDLRNETINLSVLAALPGDREAPATIIGPLENPKLTVDRGKLVGDFMKPASVIRPAPGA